MVQRKRTRSLDKASPTYADVQAEQTRVEGLDDIVRMLLGTSEDNLTPFRAANQTGNETFPAVLDCGCNGGTWIERMLEYHAGNLDITGVDIFFGSREDSENGNGDSDSSGNGNGNNAVQDWERKRWNLNAPFREDQSRERLTPETFDLINSRYLMAGIDSDRWPGYVQDLSRLLKPGAWLQMVEIQLPIVDHSGQLADDSALKRWWERYRWCMERMNRNVLIGRSLDGLLRTQRLANVTTENRNIRIGDWDPDQVVEGTKNVVVAEEMLESLSLFPFMHPNIGGMDEAAYRRLISDARAELRDPQFRLYYKIHISYGQRPVSP